MKKTVSVLIVLVMIFALAACGGKTSASDKENSAKTETQQTSGNGINGENAESEQKQVSGEESETSSFTDPDVGYTLLCPDLPHNVDGCTSYWVKKNEDDDLQLLYGYCEYEEGNVRYPQSPSEISGVQDLPLFFSKSARETMLNKLTYIDEYSMDNLTCETIEVSGLPALSFKGTVTDMERDFGFTGICIMGNMRPYMFWALDATEDMSMLDEAAEVLAECVVNFTEGQ